MSKTASGARLERAKRLETDLDCLHAVPGRIRWSSPKSRRVGKLGGAEAREIRSASDYILHWLMMHSTHAWRLGYTVRDHCGNEESRVTHGDRLLEIYTAQCLYKK